MIPGIRLVFPLGQDLRQPAADIRESTDTHGVRSVSDERVNNVKVRAKLTELRQKGWTLASIARELGQAIRTVESWNQGRRSPANLQPVLASLDGLLKRKRIPKKKQRRARKQGS